MTMDGFTHGDLAYVVEKAIPGMGPVLARYADYDPYDPDDPYDDEESHTAHWQFFGTDITCRIQECRVVSRAVVRAHHCPGAPSTTHLYMDRDGNVSILVAEPEKAPELPPGLCGDRGDHAPHDHVSEALGAFRCTADQSTREPWASEQRRSRNGRGLTVTDLRYGLTTTKEDGEAITLDSIKCVHGSTECCSDRGLDR